MADAGKKFRDWLTDKLGNPIMPSAEKKQIRELDEEEQRKEDALKKERDDVQGQVVGQYEQRRGKE